MQQSQLYFKLCPCKNSIISAIDEARGDSGYNLLLYLTATLDRDGSRIFGGRAKQSLGWRCTPNMLCVLELRGSGDMPPPPLPGKLLKIDAKILQFRDVSTYYTTLKIRYSLCVNGKVRKSHTLIISRAGIWLVYS